MSEEYVHIIDGSFDGLLTSVFEGYISRRYPSGVFTRDMYQPSFYDIPRAVDTDPVKAGRVRDGIIKKLGRNVYEQVWTAHCSFEPARLTIISDFIKFAFTVGRGVMDRLADPAVLDLFMLCRNIGRETNKLLGFIRFSIMESGIKFASITPENDQIPLLMQHFADRSPNEPFVLYDTRRQTAGIFDTREWYITDARDLRMPAYAEDEEYYRELWRAFYKAVAVEGRINPKLQRNLMPKRYWRNMTEHNGPPSSLPNGLPDARKLGQAQPH